MPLDRDPDDRPRKEHIKTNKHNITIEETVTRMTLKKGGVVVLTKDFYKTVEKAATQTNNTPINTFEYEDFKEAMGIDKDIVIKPQEYEAFSFKLNELPTYEPSEKGTVWIKNGVLCVKT